MSTAGSDLLFEQKEDVEHVPDEITQAGNICLENLNDLHAHVELEDYLRSQEQQKGDDATCEDDDAGRDLMRALECEELFKPFPAPDQFSSGNKEESSGSSGSTNAAQATDVPVQIPGSTATTIHIEDQDQPCVSGDSSSYPQLHPDLALEGSNNAGVADRHQSGLLDHVEKLVTRSDEDTSSDPSMPNPATAGLLEDLAGVIVNNNPPASSSTNFQVAENLLFPQDSSEDQAGEPGSSSKDDGIFAMGILPIVGEGAFGGSQQEFLMEQQMPQFGIHAPASSSAAGFCHLPHPHPPHHHPHSMQHLHRSFSIGHLPVAPPLPSFYQGIPQPPSSLLSPALMESLQHGIAPSSMIRRVLSTGDIQPKTTAIPGTSAAASSSPSPQDDPASKVGRYTPEERKVRIDRYRQKRSERNYIKKIKYACRKTLADSRPRIRGRFAKNQDAGLPQMKRKLEDDDDDDCDVLVEDDEDYIVDKDVCSSDFLLH